MHDILPNIFKCLKEQQYIRNVVHQDLRYLGRVELMWTKITQENRLMHAKRFLKKLQHPEEFLWFFSDQKHLHQNEKVNPRNKRWLHVGERH
ncbi:unnamed protein product [Hymenolepis diminuta]|uniref:Uncharacterized protein n=1 Tax=Hymenolepis diminuta TaxID=6216 RepID=A0A564YGQ9_HYMDI|nr:unnamed protein product [Hymenolepis diminuta]